MSIYRRVLNYYRDFWPATVVALALSLTGIALNLLKPWPFKIIVDYELAVSASTTSSNALTASGSGAVTWLNHFVGVDRARHIAALCIVLILIQLVWSALNWLSNYIFVKVGLQALLKLRTDLY